MTVKIVTSVHMLMVYARALGKARMGGDSKEIAQAQAKHDAYAALCLGSDEMLIGFVD